MKDDTFEPPWHLRSNFRRWCSLFLITGFMAIASGPLQSWQTLEPIMVSEGAFRSSKDPLAELDAAFSLGMGVMLLASLPTGLLFDKYGPRALAIIGAFLTGLCLIGMSLSLQFTGLNIGILIFYPLASVSSALNSFGAYCFLWLLPDNPNLVTSVIAATMSVADTLGTLAVWLNSAYGLTMWQFYYVLAGIAIASTLIMYMLVPSYWENRYYMDQLMRREMGEQVYEFVLEMNAKEEAEQSTRCLGRERALIYDSWCVGTKLFPQPARLIFFQMVSLYMLIMSLAIQQFAYYKAMFGKSSATLLVDYFAIIYGAGGAVAVIIFGVVADRIGIYNSFIFINVVSGLFFLLALVPSMLAQIGACVLMTMVIQVYMVVVPRICMVYCPPQLLGTSTGILFSLLGLGQMLSTGLLAVCTSLLLPGSGLELARYMTGIVLWGVLSLVSGTLLLLFWWGTPPPKAGQVTLDDVRKAQGVQPDKAQQAAIAAGFARAMCMSWAAQLCGRVSTAARGAHASLQGYTDYSAVKGGGELPKSEEVPGGKAQ